MVAETFYFYQLTISVLLGILICFIECTVSQTDVSSFGIFASSDSASTTRTTPIRLLLSWNTEQWECMINETISESVGYYMCTSGDFEPNGTLITNTLSSNTYEMKIELLIEDNINDLIRIETIRVVDDDVNYYDIDTFCLPPPFQQTAARGTTSERMKCCYWSQRYSYNNYAMSADLKISYAQFRSNVLNYHNQAHEGAIKPPMITELGLTTLNIEGAGSSSDFSITLHWDTEEYSWSLQPNERNKTFIKTDFSESKTFCEFSSGFSLEMIASSNDTLGIDAIIVTDESGHYYNMDMFCPSDQIEEWQRYNNSEKQCDSEWSEYTMYHGLIYSGTNTIYLSWDTTLFLNVDKKQQGLILNDEYFPQYSCDDNDVPIVAPRGEFTLFKDKMDDPVSTGWSFQGTYRESLNAVNCPRGSTNKCSRLAGYEGSTTIDSSMEITIDVSNYDNLVDVSIQYDLVLSTMPSGKSCYVYYAFDGGSFYTGKTHTSSGITLQTFLNQSFIIPDHTDLEYKNITIKFLNNAVYDNEYCYIDALYVFVGDTYLEFDDCAAFDSSWTYNGASIVTSHCYSGSCILLDVSSDWALKTYDITRYNNLMLRVDFKIQGYSIYDRACKVYYFYDYEPDSLLGSVSGDDWNSYPNRIFSIPDSEICGASTLSVRFKSDDSSYNTDCTVDNIVLLGNILDTASPTKTPTKAPTKHPTLQTFNPSFHPTADPTSAPTIDPTIYTSSNPTLYPTVYPTLYPTTDPTAAPTMNPTIYPTIYPTVYPTTDPISDPTTDPTVDPTVYPTSYPTTDPISDPTIYPTVYPTSNPTTDPIFDPTSNPSINPTTFPTKKPTKLPTKGPSDRAARDTTKYSINSDISIHSSLVNDSTRNNAQNTNTPNPIKTVTIVFIVVCVLVLLLLISVKIYTLYQNKANVHDIQEQRNHNINIEEDAGIEMPTIEGNELGMTPFNQNGNSLGNTTTDNGGKDIEDILERQKQIKIWFEKHVKLKESNQKYYSLFMLNGYDQLSLIAEITNEELVEMGIDKMAHRNRIIKAVQMLTTDYIN